MQFSRVGEHTVRCIISEDEIAGLGYTLDDIMTNSERTQEFMNQIFDMAEQEFAMHFDLGIKTVRADFLPDHNISLTFSEHQSTQMMEHLKDIVSGMLNSIPQEKWDEMKESSQKPIVKEYQPQSFDQEVEDITEVVAMVTLDSFELAERYAKQINMIAIPDSRLYKLKDDYVLAMDLTGYLEKEVVSLSMVTDEYCKKIAVGRERLALLEEHGQIIIDENAIESLQAL